MVNPKFVFKHGKYAGKTYEWVEENAPHYLTWVRENAPNLLKEAKPKTTEEEKSFGKIEPNTNFLNEEPHELSKPYLLKMKKPEEDDWGF